MWEHVSLFQPSKHERGISLMLLLLLLDVGVQTTTQSTTNSEAKDHALQAEQEDAAVMDVDIIIGGDILDKVVQLPNPSMVHHSMKRHLLPFHPTLALVCTIPSLHQFGHGTTSPFFSPDSSLSSQLSTPYLDIINDHSQPSSDPL